MKFYSHSYLPLICIILLLVLFNLVNLYNYQQFYVRAIISFIFLLTVPGYLVSILIKRTWKNFWVQLLNIVGLSISTIIFTSLTINFMLPFISVTQKPLSFHPLLIAFNVIIGILLTANFIKYKNHNVLSYTFGIKPLDIGMFLVALIFPLMSILGAITLNNGGSNIITMTMLGIIPIYFLILCILRNKISENLYPWSVWMVSIAFLLMGWMRSWNISGADINIEYQIFQIVKGNRNWDFTLLDHAYNACLSVTLLPTVLSTFMRVNDIYVFKLFIPIIFSLSSIGVYLIIRKYTNKTLSLLSTLFFITQPTFLTWWWIPIRQEIALFFFILSILMILSSELSLKMKQMIFIIFTFSMIVSHYSTSYIGIGLFTFTYLSHLFWRRTSSIKIFKKAYHLLGISNLNINVKPSHNLTLFSVVTSIAFAVIWYSNQPTIANNFVNVLSKTVINIGEIGSNKNRVEGASLDAQWNIFYSQKDKQKQLLKSQQDYTVEYTQKDNINSYPKESYQSFNLKTAFPETISPKLDQKLGSATLILIELIKKMVKIFIIIGSVYLILRKLGKNEYDDEFIILIAGGLVAMLAILALPFISIDYDLMRQYQQILVTLSYACIVGGLLTLFYVRINYIKHLLIGIFVLIYYLSQSGFISQFIGGNSIYVHLNNYGDSYNQFYVHDTELASSKWLDHHWSRNEFIYADNRAAFKLWFLNNQERNKIKKVILPSTLDTNAYVYSSYTNTMKNITYLSTQGEILNYYFPTQFLENNKNIIYTNGESKIYR